LRQLEQNRCGPIGAATGELLVKLRESNREQISPMVVVQLAQQSTTQSGWRGIVLQEFGDQRFTSQDIG
jgi:hypothetical protein